MGRHTKPPAAVADTRQPTEGPKAPPKLAKHMGEVARNARLRARLTQADVAERVGLATEVYGRLERGGMLPSVPTLLKLCFVLGADANALLGISSGLLPVLVDEPKQKKEEESPRVRQVLRHLRRLTPTQLNAIGHVASTFAKSNTAPSDGRDECLQEQST
ncbi:hypothetical protein BO221_51265 [Archangium sp. Cb G35]|nr:hypothetical protein BO221_51265 [Archangium sp. Cb G35]